MLNSIILLGGLVSAFGLGAINSIQEKQDNTQFRLENHRSVRYDDEQYKITLSADELNNYTWNNFNELLVFAHLEDNEDIDVYIAEFEYDSATFDESTLTYNPSDDYVNFSYNDDGYSLIFNYFPADDITFNDNKFRLAYDDSLISFANDLIISCVSNVTYSNVKQAIELDIQANQPNNDYSPILGDIVSLLTGGIVGLASGLGAGVSALVGDIFINNGSLSVFGYMVVIFAGIALAIGLSRWIMNFLTSLGAKK